MVARGTPLVVIVDGAHWLDGPSAEAFAFLARRVDAVPLAFVVARRPDEGVDTPLPGARTLPLSGLGAAAARDLLAASSPEPLDAAVAERLLEVAGGNPLALRELPRTLSPAQRRGRESLPEALRAGDAVSGAFRRRLEALDPTTRTALAVVAAAGDEDADAIRAACHASGVSEDGLERAAAAGILRSAGARVTFVHPLLRAVVLEVLPATRIRAAHRALAAVSGDEPSRAEARARHLAAAAIGPDDAAAAAMEQAAGAAAARTAYGTAQQAMARAAALSGDDDDRARRLLQAAGLAQAAGAFPDAVGLLEQAAAAVRHPGLAAEIDHARGMVRILVGPLDEGIRLLFGSAGTVAAHDPERAATMFVDSSLSWGMAGEPSMCIVACREAMRLNALGDRGRARLELALANSLFFVGRGPEARVLAARAAANAERLDAVGADAMPLVCGMIVMMYAGAFAEGSALAERLDAACRDAGTLGPLPFYLTTEADLRFREGSWARGRAAADEGARLGEETGQIPIAGYGYSILARYDAAMGADDPARVHIARGRAMAAVSRSAALDMWFGHAHGLLEVTRGRWGDAADVLDDVADFWDGAAVRCAQAIPWRQDHIEALVRLGRVVEARRRLRRFVEEAHMASSPQALALATRCRGLIAPDFTVHFEEALSQHAREPVPFEMARTHLLHGERLRRDRRRARARHHLARARGIFAVLGARPWQERADTELLAAGGQVERPSAPGLDVLTPRELQVALLVADGRTNRQTADALFTSEKSVERHLSAAYAKLGLRSRAELARLVAAGGRPPR